MHLAFVELATYTWSTRSVVDALRGLVLVLYHHGAKGQLCLMEGAGRAWRGGVRRKGD
jgi:hypothetical protein